MAVASLAFVVWGFGILISIVFGWPAQFGEPGDPDNVAGLCTLAALILKGSATRGQCGVGVLLAASLPLSGVRELVGRRQKANP